MKSLLKIKNNLNLLIFITLAFASCSETPVDEHNTEEHPAEENSVELTPEQFKTAQIKLGQTVEKELSGTIKVNGLLDVPPQNFVSISAAFPGYVKSTEMLQGMYVKKGQKIAVLENPEYIQLQQDYLDFKSQLDFLKLEFDRQQELSKENVNSLKTLQKAKSDFESMRARVNGIKTKLSMMHISIANLEKGNIQSTIPLFSPINGYITQVNTNIGMFAGATDILFKIADTEHLHAELTVYEKDIPSMKIGQKVRFTLANEEQERTATVYLIGREISKERTVNIHCHLDKEDTQLLPGTYLKAFVELEKNKTLAVPNQAIVDFEGEKFIFATKGQSEKTSTLKSHHYEMIKVIVGVSELGFSAVHSSAKMDLSSRKIVISGAFDLLSQMMNQESDGHGH